MVKLDDEKISKSLGNLVFVSDLLKDWDPRAIRLAVLSHHYRFSWEWRDELMDEATERLSRWAASGAGSGGLKEVRAALDDDLHTDWAIEAIDKAINSKTRRLKSSPTTRHRFSWCRLADPVLYLLNGLPSSSYLFFSKP